MSSAISQNNIVIITIAGVLSILTGVTALCLILWFVARRRRHGDEKNDILEKWKRKLMKLFDKTSEEEAGIVKRVLTQASCSSISTKSRESIISCGTSHLDYSTIQQPSISTSADQTRTLLCPSPLANRRFSGPCSPNHLGSINPTLYLKGASKRRSSLGASVGAGDDFDEDDDDDDYPPGHLGKVRFSVHYSMDSEKLVVTLHQARGLPSRSPGSASACDPFFKLTLLPDTRSQTRSSFKKKSCNPRFEETFVFQVPVKDFDNRTLKLTACDVDRLRRHNVIGHVTYPLKTSGIMLESGSKKVTVQRDLEDEDAAEMPQEVMGEILISLSYNERTERLNVGVYEGKAFKRVLESGPMDFYVKVSLMRNNTPIKSKKTDVIRGDDCPKFKESFSFKQPHDGLLQSACVVVSVLQGISGQKDKMLGRVVIGSFMFARGRELEHWTMMLAKQQENVTYWHQLT